MTPTYLEIANEVLLELERFDRGTGPEGLYASEERQPSVPASRWGHEWTLCLRPCITRLGLFCDGDGGFRENPRQIFSSSGMAYTSGTATANLQTPDRDRVAFDMIKVSKIKVRKYGDTYRIDPHFDFVSRWESLRFDSYLRHFQPMRSSRRFLLLIGFDARNTAFGRELDSLNDDCNWGNLGWSMVTHSWLDPHNRGFTTRASLWFPTQTF